MPEQTAPPVYYVNAIKLIGTPDEVALDLCQRFSEKQPEVQVRVRVIMTWACAQALLNLLQRNLQKHDDLQHTEQENLTEGPEREAEPACTAS